MYNISIYRTLPCCYRGDWTLRWNFLWRPVTVQQIQRIVVVANNCGNCHRGQKSSTRRALRNWTGKNIWKWNIIQMKKYKRWNVSDDCTNVTKKRTGWRNRAQREDVAKREWRNRSWCFIYFLLCAGLAWELTFLDLSLTQDRQRGGMVSHYLSCRVLRSNFTRTFYTSASTKKILH